jgi:hypothetical protein
MICNEQMQESVDSPSVEKIEGLYVCGRSGSDVCQGSLKAASVLCVNRTFSFWLQYKYVKGNKGEKKDTYQSTLVLAKIFHQKDNPQKHWPRLKELGKKCSQEEEHS